MGNRIDINDLPLKYQQQAYAQMANEKKSDNRVTVRGSIKEPSREPALDCESKIPQIHSPCHLTVSVWRCGDHWDADNRETKAIQDALVKGGVLKDDTIKEVPGTTKYGYRCKTKAEEKTIITLEWT